jgi:hypothetical protein
MGWIASWLESLVLQESEELSEWQSYHALFCVLLQDMQDGLVPMQYIISHVTTH